MHPLDVICHYSATEFVLCLYILVQLMQLNELNVT
jgi:hypothetical protein